MSRLWLPLLMLVPALSACTPERPKNEADASSVIGYNYTSHGIQEFFVDGGWGGALGIGEGGGKIVCCVVLPPKWSPGLTAKVEWRRSDCGREGPGGTRCPVPVDFEIGQKLPEWQHRSLKREVAVEPYEKPGALQVVFLPNDEVKIYIESASVTPPDHPTKLGRARPLDNPDWKAPE